MSEQGPSGSLKLWEVTSLLHHHDSITGTEKEAVAQDYHKRLSAGDMRSTPVGRSWSVALTLLMSGSIAGLAAAEAEYLSDVAELAGRRAAAGSLSEQHLQRPGHAAGQWLRRKLHEQETALGGCSCIPVPHAKSCLADEAGLSMCPFLNASACAATVEATRNGQGFKVVLYNPLAWPRKELVRVPISTAHAYWTVSGGPRHMQMPAVHWLQSPVPAVRLAASW